MGFEMASTMAERITDFQHLTDELNRTDYFADPLGWDEVADRRCRALEALLDERPTSIAQFADKFEVLIPIAEEEDSGNVVLTVLAEDMHILARGRAMLNDLLAVVFAVAIVFNLMLVILSIGGNY
jgi:hypothetical protein